MSSHDRKTITMRLLLSLILSLIITSVAASADKSTGGFAAHVGMGSMYGTADGVGAAVEYQVPLRPTLRPAVMHLKAHSELIK
jgi:H+/Cl- antiporter ClcA